MNQSYWDMIGKFQYFNQIEICKSILMQNQESQFTFKLKQKALSFQRISNIQTNWFVIWTKFHNSNTISLFLSKPGEARGGQPLAQFQRDQVFINCERDGRIWTIFLEIILLNGRMVRTVLCLMQYLFPASRDPAKLCPAALSTLYANFLSDIGHCAT